MEGDTREGLHLRFRNAKQVPAFHQILVNSGANDATNAKGDSRSGISKNTAARRCFLIRESKSPHDHDDGRVIKQRVGVKVRLRLALKVDLLRPPQPANYGQLRTMCVSGIYTSEFARACMGPDTRLQRPSLSERKPPHHMDRVHEREGRIPATVFHGMKHFPSHNRAVWDVQATR